MERHVPEHVQRPVSRAFVLAGALLLLAGGARAGSFTTPFSFPCAADFLEAIYPAPDVFVAVGDAKLCTKLCKSATKDCKAWAKSALKCQGKLFGDAVAYQNANCVVLYSTGELLKQCRADVKSAQSLAKSNVRDHLDAFLSDCEGWGADCATECLAQ
jgi:hypothetical protein